MVGKERLRRYLKWSQRGLFACAILLLGYCGFAMVDAWIFQRRENANLNRLLLEKPAASEAVRQPPPAAGSLIGRIEIPRLHLSVVVVEGVDKTELRRAVGHVPGTALPGEAGNVGLAGHRDTFFRPLKDLKIRDAIQLSTVSGTFQYEVVWLKIVVPEDVEVLAPLEENVLTLVTCYPFYFVGPAPKRWIVRARQVSSQSMASSTVK